MNVILSTVRDIRLQQSIVLGSKVEPLRVVVFAPHFAEYATRLALGLSSRCTVLLLLDSKNRANECNPSLMATLKKHVSLFEYRVETRRERRFYLVALLLRVLLFRPHIIHLQEQGDDVTVFAVKVLRRFFKIALTVHDPKPHSGNDAAYARRRAPFLRVLRETAVLFHVHGPFCRALLTEVLGNSRPIVSTAHGALMIPQPEERRPFERNRFLLFGRMEAYKGVETGLDALDRLAGTDSHLVLAGRGPELERLADRLARHSRVTVIPGFLTPSDVIEQMQRASFLIAPYRDATQSGVVAAAFGNGRPIIATRVGGLVDAIRDGVDGLLVEQGDSHALGEAITRVLDDDALRAHLAAGATASAETVYDWDQIAGVLIEAYRNVLRLGETPAASAAEAR